MASSILNKLNIPHTSLTAQKLSQADGSMARLSACFDAFRLPNITIRIKPAQLAEVSLPAVAHCEAGGAAYFVLLQHLQNNQISYYQEDKGEFTETVEAFAQKWSGTLMLLAPDAHTGEPNYAANRQKEQQQKAVQWLAWGVLAVLTSPLSPSGDIMSLAIFTLLKVLYALGVVVSVLLLQQEYGQAAKWVQQLCSVAGQAQGCGAVVQSAGGKVWGIGWAEVGLVYFGGSLYHLTLNPSPYGEGLEYLLSLLVLLYVPFSVYYQAVVVRSWCVLCLVVQGLLVAIAAVWLGVCGLSTSFFEQLGFYAVFSFVVPFALVAALWVVFKPFWEQARQFPTATQALEQWRQDSGLFKAYLAAQPVEALPILPHEDHLGHADAPVEVLMVSNPRCGPCQDAYQELTGWVQYFEDEMQLRIRHINSDEEKYASHEAWAQEVGIEYTPTLFINGHRLRAPYGVEDVWRHVRALSEQTVF